MTLVRSRAILRLVMNLSLPEVATLLGKSERQVRYMIKQGRLRANKHDGKWTIDEADLPLSAQQRKAMATRVDAARSSFERAVAPAEKVAGPRRGRVYSVTRLAAFQLGEALYRDIRRALGETAATELLFSAVGEITHGCHSFQPEDKSRHFGAARRFASTALTHLLLGGDEPCPQRRAFAERLESEFLPRISGLLAIVERRARRLHAPQTQAPA